jgi:hypothetical protein
MTPVVVDVGVWVLTGLALLVVVLTRLRLSARPDQSGVTRVPQNVVNGHSLVGLLAVLVWVGYLRRVGDQLNVVVGAVALLLWWIEVGLGLLILSRWRGGRGRHASERRGDGWTDGPWLSVLAHVGMLAGVIAFSALFVSDISG